MIILQTALLAFGAILSVTLAAVEAAFYLVKRRRLSHLSQQNPRAELVNRYLDDPPALLMPVHIGTYTTHVGMTIVCTSLLWRWVGGWSLPIAFLVMLVYLLLIRLTLPYALVRRSPERSLLVLLPGFHLYARLLSPLVAFLRKQAAFEERSASEPVETAGSAAVPEVPPPLVHDPDEGRLIDSVVRFATTHVRDVMTPRPDIVAVSQDTSFEDLRRVFRETKYSRVPVFGENLDDIVGVVGVRDLLDAERDAGEPLRNLARPAFVVPETKKIAELLKEFQAAHSPFAVVIDEYGGTAGIVTDEDIVEEIVGELTDEYDVEADPIAVEADGSVLVAGRVHLSRLQQALDAPLAEGDEVSTVGGLVTAVFGRVPRVGEAMEYRGFIVEVLDAERKRVNRVRFRRVIEPTDS